MVKNYILIVLLAVVYVPNVLGGPNNNESLARFLKSAYSSSSGGNGNNNKNPTPLRLQYELYKALIGETVRLECPQPNPTWFFRRSSSSSSSGSIGSGISSPSSSNNNLEDLIVTRHGVINADYKYKIMCHMTLKHKVIIVNNVEFEDEGLYTCLYTLPASLDADGTGSSSSVQYRYVFNVTVYTLLSGLSMSLKPISMAKTTPMPSILSFNQQLNPNAAAKKSTVGGTGSSSSSSSNSDGYELVDSSLTVRQNEEFLIICTVESSKPAAEIKFSMAENFEPVQSLNSNNGLTYLTLSPGLVPTLVGSMLAPSVLESSSSVMRNGDKTMRTIHTARIKVNRDDHGKMITCKAENGFSNQKWENKKLLNVLFPPVCKDSPRHTYYVGINQTVTIECNILSANPSRVQFEWNLNDLNYNSPISSGSLGGSGGGGLIKRQLILDSNPPSSISLSNLGGLSGSIGSLEDTSSILLAAADLSNQGSVNSGVVGGSGSAVYQQDHVKPKFTELHNEGFASRFKWRPSGMSDFGDVVCKATNEIGTTDCVYEIRLGGVPNPPSDCTHVVKNTSAIISCQVGFHQGDPDIYCYLLRKSDNGVYKEHTRNRESCSFIVNDVNVNKLNEFWIYSSNKHGHNKDSGVYLTIGQTAKPIQQTTSKNWIIFGIVAAICLFVALVCCFGFKVKKSSSDDSDSMFEGDNYQQSRNIIPSSVGLNGMKKLSNGSGYSQPSKIMKGIKVSSQDNLFESNEQKYVKIDFYPLPPMNENQKYTNYDQPDYSSDSIKKKDPFASNDELSKADEAANIEPYYADSTLTTTMKQTLKNHLDTPSSQFQSEYKSINDELKRKKFMLFKNNHNQNQMTPLGPPYREMNKSMSFTKARAPEKEVVGLLTTATVAVNNNNNNSNTINKHVNSNNNNTSSSNSSSSNSGSSSGSEKSSSSLSEGNIIQQQASSKMVTFSSNSMMRGGNKGGNNKSGSATTTETASTSLTMATNDGGDGSGGSTASTGTSASPSASSSSAHNELDLSNEVPLTVSDQSFVLQRPTKLSMANRNSQSFFSVV